MKLRAVRLVNFRAYKGEVTIPIDDLTALVGKNDIGKSSVLEALGIFLGGTTVKMEACDLCVRAETRQMRIGCVFTDLPAELVLDATSRTTLAAEHLLNADGDLEVHKVFECRDGKLRDLGVIAVADHPSAAGLDDLLLLKNEDLKRRVTERGLDVDRRVNAQMRRALWAAGGDLAKVRTEIPLNREDAKEVWDQLQAHLPVFALFKADRPSTDEDAEVQDPMKLAIKQALAEVQDDLVRVQRAIAEKAVDVATRTLEKLREMDASLGDTLTPEFRSDPKWDGIFKLALSGDDGIPLNKRGSGVRRLVLLSFFRAEVERKREAAEHKDVIYAIEEPEASQHPDNQRMLVEALKELSTAPNCQVILTTHVPALAGMLPTESVRHIVRSGDRTSAELYSDEMLQRVADDLGVLPDARVKVVVCVEGRHDVCCLRLLAAALRAAEASLPDLSDCRVAIIPMGGNTLKEWVEDHYLRNTHLPEVHIYDRGNRTPPKFQVQCDRVNGRGDGSRAFLTCRPELENYLHPDAVRAGMGVEVELPPGCDVPEVVARALHEADPSSRPWGDLDETERKGKHTRVKRRLNRDAARHMTAALLDEVATAEIKTWLSTIATHLD